jgi:pyruvate formate lyase activating enzyme
MKSFSALTRVHLEGLLMITDKVDSGATGVIFNIQRYTVHDGPGTRTELFLKGCPLRCLWCSNPEGFNIKPEIGVYPDRCIGIDKCGYCLQACTEENKDKEIIGRFNNLVKEINRDLCTNCLKCAEVCPGSSLVVWGKEMTVQETLQEVLKDRVFYGNKGGVTISGGEPLVQWKFTLEFLKACKNAGINTCIESTFHTPWDVAEQVLKYTDYILTDIKLMDSNKHKECTGVGNELILANLAKMSKMGIPYILRTPIVPNFNDDDEPERVDLRQRPEYLSIPRSTLLGWWSGIPEEKRNSAAKILLVTNNNESEFQWEWKSVNSETDLRSAPFLIALNPAFATYNRYYGLILTHGGEYRTGYQGASQVKEIYSYSYKRECFSEHVRRVLQALQSQRGQETARKRLSQLMALKLQTIKRLEKLTAVLHDTGKLTVLWQKAAADWQKDRNGTIDNVLLAHTDFDPYNQWDKEHYRNAAFIRPPHAIEGAIAVSRLVMDICNKWAGDEVGVLVTRAVLAAISCHHSSRARKLMKSYKYHPNSSAIMVDIMQQCGIHLKKWVPTLCPERTDINEFAEVIEQAVSGEGMFLYWHLVRSLRLADQRSFEVV